MRSGLVLKTAHRELEPYWLYGDAPDDVLFTENETNTERLFGVAQRVAVREGCLPRVRRRRPQRDAVNPVQTGTKAAPHYVRTVGPGETAVVRLRLASAGDVSAPLGTGFDAMFARRQAGGRRVLPARHAVRAARRHAQRPAAGVRRHAVEQAVLPLHGATAGSKAIPRGPPPPEERKHGRNHEWWHFAAGDVLSMPDKWEYPWFAAWDMAFHCVAFAMIDPEFAKEPAAAAHARVVHASERPDPRLRMGVRRRQPAGARVGGDPRLPDRAEDVRPQGPRVSRAHLPEAADQLHVVGQSQGRRGQQHLRRRLSRPRQHRRVRPHLGAALRRSARAGRRHELDGDVLPQHARRSRSSSRRRTRSTRTSRPSSSSTSSTSARRSTGWAAAKAACGTKRTATTSMCSSFPDGRVLPDQGAVRSAGADPDSSRSRIGDRDRSAGFPRLRASALRWFAMYRPGPARTASPTSTHQGVEERVRLAHRRFAQAAAHPRARAGRGRDC